MGGLTVVTGGAGFIGSHLVQQLIDSGHQVRVIEKPGVSVDHLPSTVDVHFADICNRGALVRPLEGAHWVYHLAANPNLWARDRGEFEAVNHGGTVNVLDAALAAGAVRVLHTSTESILTRAKQSGPIDENIRIELSDAVGPYCRSKLLAEQYALFLAGEGLPVVVANPTMPVGPGDRNLSPPSRLVLDFCLGNLPMTMKCTLNLIDVRDVAHGLRLVMQKGEIGRRYILGNTNLTLEELLAILSELAGIPVPRFNVPYGLALSFAWFSEMWADRVSRRSPKATLTGVRLGRRIMHFDSSRTDAELGLAARPVRESLTDMIAWLRQTGHLPSHASASGSYGR
jgi:hopanoid-associated sugar epimerase